MNLPLERLDLLPMASGNESLLLTERVGWESCPTYAEAISSWLERTIVDRADSPVERVWTVRIGEWSFWLAYDDYPGGVSLDPKDSNASALIPAIRQRLLDLREQRTRPAGREP